MPTTFGGTLLALVMVEQTILQAALALREMFNGTKSKFKAWTEAVENVAEISGQNAIWIAFSNVTAFPLLTVNRLKTMSPNLMWADLNEELSMQYSIVPSDIHTTQAFTYLEQGPDKLLDNYLYHVSDLLLKIYHTSNMSRISVKDTNHYAVVYGLNCRNPKDSMAGHKNSQWKTVVECFRDIGKIGVGYK